MKFVQRLFMGIGGLAAAAALLAVLAPRAAHAVTATLVEVVNTRSTPVPNQDVDHPGRHPYQQSCNSGGNPVQNGFMSCQMPAVPPNTEVVIQNVSVDINLAPGPQQFGFLLTQGGGVGAETLFPLVSVAGRYIGNQPTTQFADPGTQPACAAAVTASGFFECFVTGYTVSLP
jgi:hypothetical protein